MDILGVGIPELILILLIMLVVAGPRRMIQWSYMLGQEIGKLRRMWEETSQMLKKELESAGIDEAMQKELRSNIDSVRRPVQTVREEVTKMLEPAEQNGKQRASSTQATQAPEEQAEDSAPPPSDEARAFMQEKKPAEADDSPKESEA